ncbi:pyruvate dehydrogenase (acetyl-transferring) E1 component subunit alpha [Mycolicibacterium pulveris]|uniref:2-oxoisovalerate dehydrogenase subunit alpha n=1 Tax=Mycolicibacterium pulveris TaxID=36813 RepID=A0A7I7UNU9_MYCPV|nr:thiamine pyrophosphate-dependent enzyme [Mycolicibacterium pulveris]MCV6983281.1 pyruvate dehydrogenase (acetyl-transferring) E1 component subunit alpha [Mycolicibacterium pulveris]BBY83154.1 pyruvate dehydrogenase E1 component subunit alpha [Mycolicibacterium pulveris]
MTTLASRAAAQSDDTTADLVRGLYRDMALGRRFDQEAYALQRQGELGLWLMSLGQEAAQAGSIRAMRPADHVFPSYREHVSALCRGITPAELLSQWRGVTHGSWDPDRYRFHIYSLVLATQTLHAVGYAMGVRYDGADEVVLAYLGDGASSQGDANEALNWAAVNRAPIVFFCQNNQWAISTPNRKQFANALHLRAAGFGLDAVAVDGNDVLAVYQATRDMVERVRAGGRPGFIEAYTYRMSGHSTSDDPKRYRDDQELTTWQASDPLERARTLLVERGWADTEFFHGVDDDAEQLAADARRACLTLPEPSLSDTFTSTLCAETAHLRDQRRSFESFKESFA